MGNRLSKIYTRTGDDGSTGLGDGSRTPKDSARVEAYGTVDELNSTLGVLLACGGLPDDIRELLVRIQHALFDLGGELCVPGMELVHDADVTGLEQTLDHYNEDLPRLKEFILPGGGMAAAQCHIARTVCRRAERRVISLQREVEIPQIVVVYLNRLSDLLFTLARLANVLTGAGEVTW